MLLKTRKVLFKVSIFGNIIESSSFSYHSSHSYLCSSHLIAGSSYFSTEASIETSLGGLGNVKTDDKVELELSLSQVGAIEPSDVSLKTNFIDEDIDNISSTQPTNLSDFIADSDGSHEMDFISDDSLISSNEVEMLDLVSDSNDFFESSDLVFANEIQLSNSPIAPSVDYHHIKKSLIPSIQDASHVLDSKIEVWSHTWDRVSDAHLDIIKQLVPLDSHRINDLDRALRTSRVVENMNVWGLAPCADNIIAKSALGFAYGAHDLAIFKESEYDRAHLRFNFNGLVGSEPTKRIRLALSNINDPVDEDYLFEFKYGDNPMPLSSLRSSFKLISETSIFSHDSYKNIASEILSIRESSSFVPTQTSESLRRAVAVKTGVIDYSDGFEISASFNPGFKFTIREKCIVDMLLSLLDGAQDPIIVLERKLKYVCTILHSYFVNQMYIREGIDITKLELDVVIEKKINTQSELHNLYKNSVMEGHIIPQSLLHYMFLFSGRLDGWDPFILCSALANLNQNPEFSKITPRMDKASKTNYKHYIQNPDLLTSKAYIGKDNLPFYIGGLLEMSKEDFIMEMMIRTASLDSIDDCYPLISRGGWSTSLRSSLQVGISRFNSVLYKFGVLEADTMSTLFSKMICEIPREATHIKKVSRCSKDLSHIFKTLVPTAVNSEPRDIKSIVFKRSW